MGVNWVVHATATHWRRHLLTGGGIPTMPQLRLPAPSYHHPAGSPRCQSLVHHSNSHSRLNRSGGAVAFELITLQNTWNVANGRKSAKRERYLLLTFLEYMGVLWDPVIRSELRWPEICMAWPELLARFGCLAPNANARKKSEKFECALVSVRDWKIPSSKLAHTYCSYLTPRPKKKQQKPRSCAAKQRARKLIQLQAKARTSAVGFALFPFRHRRTRGSVGNEIPGQMPHPITPQRTHTYIFIYIYFPSIYIIGVTSALRSVEAKNNQRLESRRLRWRSSDGIKIGGGRGRTLMGMWL